MSPRNGDNACARAGCTHANPPSARFCGRCGLPLRPAGDSESTAASLGPPLLIAATLVALPLALMAGSALGMHLPCTGVSVLGLAGGVLVWQSRATE